MFRACAILVLVGGCCLADDVWPEWRGPTGQGHSAAKNLPVSWGESKNVAWKLDLKGRGNSTPVIVDGKVWLTTSTDKQSSKEEAAQRREGSTNSMPMRVSDSVSLRVLCVDLESGKQLHDVEVLNQKNPQMVHIDNTYATPSPIAEDGRLYCYFGPSGFVCLDMTSLRVLWENRDLEVAHENGAASSPVLWKNLLILHCDGIDQQYVTALDKATGKPVWKTQRSGKKHKNPQLRKAYATPLVAAVNGQDQVISPGADWLYGYDPVTGKELWRLSYGDLGFSNSARPVVGNGLIYICTGYMKSRLLAVHVDESNTPKIAWEYRNQVPNVASPVLIEERIYFASDKGVVSAVNAVTGKKIFSDRIGARFWSSPLFADGRLYFFDRTGTTVVMEPGSKSKVLAKNKLDGQLFATAAPVDGSLVLRTDKALYRIAP